MSLRTISKPAGMSGLLVAIVSLALTAGSALAVPTFYEVDPNHSAASFQIRHFFSMVPGQFKLVAGGIQFDEAVPANSSAELTIQAASIDTGQEKRDGHLRSGDFFEVEKYPTITFKSARIEKTEESDRYKVSGDLTIRGVTQPVVVDVQLLGFGADGMGGERAGFLGTTTINRKDFGINWNKALDNGGAMLGDDVKIEFAIEAVKKETS